MPLGRLVLARIVKVEDQGQSKRYNLSLRKSLVVFGTNAIDKNSLAVGGQVECMVLAIADGSIFAQIKGSYHKLKIKDAPKGALKVGDLAIVTLKKVTKQKISGSFVNKQKGSALTDTEKQVDKLWKTIEEEA